MSEGVRAIYVFAVPLRSVYVVFVPGIGLTEVPFGAPTDISEAVGREIAEVIRKVSGAMSGDVIVVRFKAPGPVVLNKTTGTVYVGCSGLNSKEAHMLGMLLPGYLPKTAKPPV